jgi:Caspase domain
MKKNILLIVLFLAVILSFASNVQSDETEVIVLIEDDVVQAFAPKRLAVVIGINDFIDDRWQSLNFAEKDALDMAWALENEEVGEFDTIIKRAGAEETNRASIMEALAQLNIENTSTEDTVFIYVSTHGTLARDKNGNLQQYLVTHNTEFDNVKETGINVNDLIVFFNRLTSRRKVLILASCHSGMGKSRLPDDIHDELGRLKSQFFVKPIEAASEASVIIGVCSWGETAQEDPKLENDIYTHFFIEGMKKYDRNEDGAISISEAHDYAQRQTYYFTKGQQRPFARSDVLGDDPIILSGFVNRSGKPVVFSYGEQLEGTMLAINGTEKGTLPDGFASTPGWTRVIAYDAETKDERYKSLVYVRAGERIDLDNIISQRGTPPLGLVTGYSMTGSKDMREEVFPEMMMVGMAYKKKSFPFTNTSLRFESSYGRAQWQAELDNGQDADLTADILSLNGSLLYSYMTDQAEYFAGPMVGALALHKYAENSYDEASENASTLNPGMMAGISLPLNPTLHLEIADRLNYNFFNTDTKNAGVLTNQVSLTVYFQPNRKTKFK